MSSPDRIHASPGVSPAKDTGQPSRDHMRDTQQAAGHENDAVRSVRPEYKVPAEAQAGAKADQASEQPQPAGTATHSGLQQDVHNMAAFVSEAQPSQQATAGEGLRTQQGTLSMEEAVTRADPGHEMLAGEEHKKQPSDVPSAYPMIVHAGAVARPPSRQTSSEFLAAIPGKSQALRWASQRSPHTFSLLHVSSWWYMLGIEIMVLFCCWGANRQSSLPACSLPLHCLKAQCLSRRPLRSAAPDAACGALENPDGFLSGEEVWHIRIG